jgi:NADH-quinone oxidoreductase subunit L
MLLCVGAVAAGWVGIPHLLGGGAHFSEFLSPVLGNPEGHGTESLEWLMMGVSIVTGLAGIGFAYFMYVVRTDLPEKVAEQFSAAYRILFNKYYVDELYSFLIVRPSLWVASNVLVGVTDAKVIEAVVNGVPGAIGGFSRRLRKIQTGFLQHYATIMAMGVLLIVALVLLR